MSLRIYNTLSRALEDFSPLEPGHVRMYVCGITVYDLCHVGHARANVAFDVVQRWLKASGYKRDLRAQHHRHRRQDHPPRRGERRNGARADRPHDRRDVPRLRRAGHRAAHARSARHRLRAADAGHRQAARGQGPGLSRRGRRRELRGAALPRLRQALRQVARRTACRRACRRARRQGRPAGLRALESGQAHRARRRPMGQRLRPRPAGLAHRVLGDGLRLAGRDLRHPRRRRRPAVPAPRERDRPERGRHSASRWRATGCTTAS